MRQIMKVSFYKYSLYQDLKMSYL